jgi:hypothetical protein
MKASSTVPASLPAAFCGKEAAVAQVAPAAHHRERHAPHRLALDHHDHVAVAGAHRLHRLAREDPLQDADLIAVLCRLLIVQRLGRCVHPQGERVDDIGLLALEKLRGMVDVAVVLLGRYLAHARRRAAPDLVQQARARAMREHRVVAGAQPEHALQVPDGLADRPGAWIGTKVAIALDVRPAVEADLRILVPRDQDVAVALVVAEEDVVAGREALDEVVLEQQRLRLGARDRGLGAGDLGDHHRRARAREVPLEVRGDALLQVSRLADVDHLAGGVPEAVDARKRGERGDERGAVEFGGHCEILR